jgi:Resolvase, N terminal domain
MRSYQKAGCEKLYREVVSGARMERPVLDRVVDSLRTGDVLVIWKLNHLGWSPKHLVELVNTLRERGVGLQSLNDPIAIPPHPKVGSALICSRRWPNSSVIWFANAPKQDFLPLAPEVATAADRGVYRLRPKLPRVLLRRCTWNVNSVCVRSLTD